MFACSSAYLRQVSKNKENISEQTGNFELKVFGTRVWGPLKFGVSLFSRTQLILNVEL